MQRRGDDLGHHLARSDWATRNLRREQLVSISYRSAGASLKTDRVPVNLDIPQPEVHLVDEDDPHVNLLGVKRLGEIDQMAQSIGNYEPPPR